MVVPPLDLPNAALLRACFGDADALAVWQSGADIEAHDADMGALLPLLHAAAERCGWTLAHQARIAGVYRYWFARNQIALAALNLFAAALHDRAIPVMALDAPLLALTAYPRPALHPIERLTVLVPPQQARAALTIALDLGWRPTAPLWPARIPTGEYASFRRDDLTLIVRWCAVDRRAAPGIDDALWARSAPLTGTTMRAPDPAHRLLLTALRPPLVWGQPVGTLWRANMRALIGAGLDWDALLTAAHHYRVTDPLHAALTAQSDSPIPPDVLRRLHTRPTWFTRYDNAAAQRGELTSPRAHLVRWRGAVRGLTPYRAARRTARYLLTAWARR